MQFTESVKTSSSNVNILFNLIAAVIVSDRSFPPTYKELRLGGVKLPPRFAQQGRVRIHTSTPGEVLTTAIALGAEQHLT